MAQRASGRPMVAIVLLDDDRSSWAAAVGFDPAELHCDGALCATAMASDVPLDIADMSAEPRFSPALTLGGATVRACAAARVAVEGSGRRRVRLRNPSRRARRRGARPAARRGRAGRGAARRAAAGPARPAAGGTRARREPGRQRLAVGDRCRGGADLGFGQHRDAHRRAGGAPHRATARRRHAPDRRRRAARRLGRRERRPGPPAAVPRRHRPARHGQGRPARRHQRRPVVRRHRPLHRLPRRGARRQRRAGARGERAPRAPDAARRDRAHQRRRDGERRRRPHRAGQCHGARAGAPPSARGMPPSWEALVRALVAAGAYPDARGREEPSSPSGCPWSRRRARPTSCSSASATSWRATSGCPTAAWSTSSSTSPTTGARSWRWPSRRRGCAPWCAPCPTCG